MVNGKKIWKKDKGRKIKGKRIRVRKGEKKGEWKKKIKGER